MALPQPLHIFRKDLIHLWPETLFVLLLFVAFAFCAPSGWAGSQFAGYIVALSWLLKIVMPISWLVLRPQTLGVSQPRLRDGAITLSLALSARAQVVVQDAVPDNAPTPLPAALPLFAGGLGLLGLMGRRRKQKLNACAA